MCSEHVQLLAVPERNSSTSPLASFCIADFFQAETS